MRLAVVIGLCPTGIGIVRSLAEKNIKVIGLESDLRAPESKTRYCKIEQSFYKTNPHHLVEKLLSIGRQLGQKAVLFMSSDDAVKIISENRDLLASHYDFSLPSNSVVKMLLEKPIFNEFAKDKGLPIPNGFTIGFGEFLNKHLLDINYPCVVKPSWRNENWQRGSSKNKIWMAKSKTELFKLIRWIRSFYPDELIVQEWIPGDDSNVYFCLVNFGKNAKLNASFTGKKIWQFPPGTGSTAIAESHECDEIYEISKKLFDLVKYKGMGSVEFKYDRRTRDFKITEPTVGRANLQSGIALLQGINIPYQYYCDQDDEKLNLELKGFARKKVIWINESRASKYLRVVGIRKTINSTLFRKLILQKKGFAIFNIRDIRPFYQFVKNNTIGRKRR